MADPLTWILGEGEDDDEADKLPPIIPVELHECLLWAIDDHGCDEAGEIDRSPFPCDYGLNCRVFTYEGDIMQLNVDVLMNPTNETFTADGGLNSRLLQRGGNDLREDLGGSDRCRSGEAVITKAYRIPARYIVHSVGPKYNPKYKSAAENTLHACYRETLKLVVDGGHRTVALPMDFAEKKGYPREEAIHVTLRTVRRWLEQLWSSIDAIIFVGEKKADLDLFQEHLCLYFPRTLDEELALFSFLPDDVGNEFGEKVCPDRQIRISGLNTEACDSGGVESGFDREPDTEFMNARGDFDEARRTRLGQGAWESEDPLEVERIYLRYLRAARSYNFREMDAMKFVYVSPGDRSDRAVVHFCAALFPADRYSNDHLMMYIIHKLDASVRQPYVLVYYHSTVSARNHPSIQMLKDMYSIFTCKYRNQLQHLFVVHPNLLFKAAFALGWAMMSSHLWNVTVYVESLAELGAFLDLDRLDLHEYIKQYDLQRPHMGLLGSLFE